jgi:hypothetical protein
MVGAPSPWFEKTIWVFGWGMVCATFSFVVVFGVFTKFSQKACVFLIKTNDIAQKPIKR